MWRGSVWAHCAIAEEDAFDLRNGVKVWQLNDERIFNGSNDEISVGERCGRGADVDEVDEGFGRGDAADHAGGVYAGGAVVIAEGHVAKRDGADALAGDDGVAERRGFQ